MKRIKTLENLYSRKLIESEEQKHVLDEFS